MTLTTTQIKEGLHSKESEMMVLGCMLSNPHSHISGCKILSDIDFHFTEHKITFKALITLHTEGKPADVHLTCEELKRQEKLEAAGGVVQITSLAQYAGTSAYFEEYIEKLKGYSNKRRLLSLSSEIQRCIERGEDPKKVILSTQEQLKLIERNKGAKDKFPIRFLSEFGEDYLRKEPPPKPMLLEYANNDGNRMGFLPKSIAAMLVGAGGVGKTHLLAQLAVSVATGTPFLDTYTTTNHCGASNQGKVFLGFGENQDDDIRRLLYKATKSVRNKKELIDAVSKNIAAFTFCGQQASFLEEGKPSIYFRELKMRLEDISPNGGWSLIILDPVSRLMGADAETDNAAATQFISLLEELTIDLPGNPTVLFAHHVNKSAINLGPNQNQTAARGSSAVTDGVRWQINYAKKPDIDNKISNLSVLQMTKSNFTPLMKAIYTEKDFDGFILKATAEQEAEITRLQTSKTVKKQTTHRTDTRYEKLDDCDVILQNS